MPPSLADAKTRLEWARAGLRDLAKLAHDFARSEIQAAEMRLNPEPNVPFAFGRPDSPIPEEIKKLSSETVGHLRSVLDYVVHELAWLDSGEEQKLTQFPIEDSSQVFWDRRRKTYLRGVSDDHVGIIESFQPYKGVTWSPRLRDLSNPDKHRRLVSAVHNTGLEAEIEAMRGEDGGETLFRVGVRIEIFLAFDDGEPVVRTLADIVRGVQDVLAAVEQEFP